MSDASDEIRSIYRSLRPHSALSPVPSDAATTLVQQQNESDWSQLLVSGIMPLLLPPEDLVNPCLDVLVSEIFSEMIVHNGILGKVCEPSLLWEGVTKVIYTLRSKGHMPKVSIPSPTNKLEQFGLLSSAEAAPESSRSASRGTFDAIILAFWSTLQYALLAWTLLRAFTTALMHASSLPSRSARVSGDVETVDKVVVIANEPATGPVTSVTAEKRPIVGMRIWSCMDSLTSLHHRMPWLSGCLSLLQWLSLHGPGQVCRTNGQVDR